MNRRPKKISSGQAVYSDRSHVMDFEFLGLIQHDLSHAGGDPKKRNSRPKSAVYHKIDHDVKIGACHFLIFVPVLRQDCCFLMHFLSLKLAI